jgi:hypothetical protein
VIAVTARRQKPVTITTVAVGQSSYTVPVGQSTTLKLALNGVGKRLLADFYTLAVNATFPATGIPDRTVTFAHPLINPTVHFDYLQTASSTATTFTPLSVAGLLHPATVRLSCRGGGCPFAQRQRTVRRRSLGLEPWISGAHLAPGATLQVAVTAHNQVGSLTSFRMRSGRRPLETALCLPPGIPSPQRCR